MTLEDNHTPASPRRLQGLLLYLVLATVLGTVVLHVLGARFLYDSLWGVHFYAFFPPLVWGVATLTLLLMAGFGAGYADAVAGRINALLSTTAQRRTAAVTAIGGFATLLWFARVRVLYLGDSSVLVTSLPRGQAFHEREPLTMWIQQQLYRFVGPLFRTDGRDDSAVAQDAVAAGSVVAGVIFLVIVWQVGREITREDSRDRAATVLVTAILVAQGYVLLFFGYVENYAYYSVAVALYMWLALRFLHGRSALLWPGLALLLAVSLHLWAVVLLPSFLVLAATAIARGPRRRRATIDLVILAVGFVVLRQIWMLAEPGYDLLSTMVRVTGVTVQRGEDVIPGYMGSRMHFRDFLNEQCLIGPIGMFFVTAALAGVIAARSWRSARFAFLAVAAMTYAAASWIVGDLNLGYARDWDLLAPGGVVFAIAGLALLVPTATRANLRTAALVSALAVSVYHSAPWVGVSASTDRGLERLKQLPLGLGRTEVLVGKWYSRHGSPDEAMRWFERAIDVYPYNNNAYYLLGLGHAERGDWKAAADAFGNAARLRPDKRLFREVLADALVESGRFAEALPHLKSLVADSPDAALWWVKYGEALTAAGRPEDGTRAFKAALPLLRRAWEASPDRFDTNLYYGMLLGRLGQLDVSLQRLEAAAHIDPASDVALYYAGYTLRLLDRTDEANAYFRRCLTVNPTHPARTQLEAWLSGSE